MVLEFDRKHPVAIFRHPGLLRLTLEKKIARVDGAPEE
jgi:hypothetical protein